MINAVYFTATCEVGTIIVPFLDGNTKAQGD